MADVGIPRSGDEELLVRVSFPESGRGRHPLVLLSHYAGGGRNDFPELVRHWVSNGYVCAQPAHRDSAEVGGERGPRARATVHTRPRDLSFLLDRWSDVEDRVPGIRGLADLERVGVNGHYMGCLAAQWMLGLRSARRAGPLRDPRVSCAVLMSPTGREGNDETAWRDVGAPMLVLTGPRDASPRTGHDARWRTDPFRLSPPGGKYLAWIDGLTSSYGGLVRGTSTAGEPAERVLTVTQTFWDAYLSDDPAARTRLDSCALLERR